MKKTKIAVIAAVAVLGLGALAGAAVKASAGSAPVKGAATPATGIYTAAAAEPAASQTDADNVQQGDQTTPDATAASQSSAEPTEAPGEQASSESATANDGPGGHADEPANANADHQFQGQE
jgi:hypothetical protein